MEQGLSDRIHRINALDGEMDALYHEAAVRLGVADSVLRVLYVLHDNGGGSCPLGEVCGRSGLCKQTLNSALRKLERQGMLRLEPYRGRAKQVCLTEPGRQLARQTAARLYEAECRAFAGWPVQEIDAQIRGMERYLEALREQVGRL